MTEFKIIINESQLEMDEHIDDPEVARRIEITKALAEVGIEEPSNWAFCNPDQFYKKLKTIFSKMIREDFPVERKVVFWLYKED